MKRLIIFLIIILISTNLHAEQNDIDKEDFFYIGKMASHNEKFTLYFNTWHRDSNKSIKYFYIIFIICLLYRS